MINLVKMSFEIFAVIAIEVMEELIFEVWGFRLMKTPW